MTHRSDLHTDTVFSSPATAEERTHNTLTRVCGTVQGEQRYERAVATRDVTSAAQGRLTHLTLLVPGPSGTPFALAVRATPATEGRALLQARDTTPGALLHVEGQLAWEQTADPRFAVAWTESGRRSLDAVLYASAIRSATPEDLPGCDVTLHGTVTRPPRTDIHPLTSERIYTARIETRTEQQRPYSRARITLNQQVSVVIPRDHPDALALLRAGNVVQIEGVLERIAVPLSIQNRAFQRKLAAAEAEWEQHAAALTARGATTQLERERGRWERQHRQLLEVTSCRIVAGYVGLVSGDPFTRAEQRALDGRRTTRRAHPTSAQRINGEEDVDSSVQHTADTPPAPAPTEPPARTRRKAAPSPVRATNTNGAASPLDTNPDVQGATPASENELPVENATDTLADETLQEVQLATRDMQGAEDDPHATEGDA